MQIAVPFVDRMAAGLRALLPPASDAATYGRLLAELGQQNHDAHAMLHAFETGQIRQGVLLARSAARLDLRLNSLANKVGLNICGLTGRQVRARYGKARGAAVPASSKAGSAPVTHSRSAGKRGAAPASRFVGSYPTSVRVLVDTTKPGLPTGYTAVRNWRFLRHCAATCTTTLLRPSIKPGSPLVFQYRLHVITGGGYRGKLNVADICYGHTTDGRPKILPTGSVVDRVVITIRPTGTRAGKVVAFSGTMVLRLKVTPWAHAHGCVARGYQKSSIKSPA